MDLVWLCGILVTSFVVIDDIFLFVLEIKAVAVLSLYQFSPSVHESFRSFGNACQLLLVG